MGTVFKERRKSLHFLRTTYIFPTLNQSRSNCNNSVLLCILYNTIPAQIIIKTTLNCIFVWDKEQQTQISYKLTAIDRPAYGCWGQAWLTLNPSPKRCQLPVQAANLTFPWYFPSFPYHPLPKEKKVCRSIPVCKIQCIFITGVMFNQYCCRSCSTSR